MWRFNATPRRVAAPYGDVPGPVSPTLDQRWGSWHQGTTKVWAELAIARAA